MKYLTILLCALFLMSCNKDREKPNINIINPTQNSEVEAGVAFSMQAEVTDNEAISSIVVGGDVQELAITGITDVMKHSFLVNVTPAADTPSGTELTITIKAKDVAGNEESEDLVVKIK